ncbi:MAGE-domain-containing protein [Auriscalpium vulgare]|uniref:MAGE-domain-containing protein n=1 Tax=Auriscalpium vulgare TaxID=40419 RepID=A0ACB8S8V7_9AGAM|nr:MAGE-domain-containing protein [Auriscalpium vulgare]
MARAGPSRTRNASQAPPTQTQPRTQRGGRNTRVVVEEEDEDAEGEAYDGEDGDGEGTAGEQASHFSFSMIFPTDICVARQETVKRAQDLVRLALFNEQKRVPLRRDDISKKVMGSQRGAFKAVFDAAQRILREKFGMELVELQTRAAAQETAAGAEKDKGKGKRGTQKNGEADAPEDGRQTVTGLKKKGMYPLPALPAAQGSKTYILRSVLDAALIELAAQTDAAILEEEAADGPEDIDDDAVGLLSYGSLLAWNGTDQLASVGILYVVLALILVNGKVLSDMDLQTVLRRLRLHPQTALAQPAHTTHGPITVDAYLAQLVRQGYLDCVRLGGPKGAKGTKRARAGADDADGASSEWRWGPRAAAEVGEAGVARFVAEFMADRMGGEAADGGESDDDMDAGQRRRVEKKRKEEAQKRLEGLARSIERAAGGELLDIV